VGVGCGGGGGGGGGTDLVRVYLSDLLEMALTRRPHCIAGPVEAA